MILFIDSKWGENLKTKIHYAWIVLFLAFLALLSAQGVRLSFGAFVTPWEDEFNSNRGIISLIAFISYIVYGISQPIFGRLLDKYGVRNVLSFSVLIIGITTISTLFATNPWHLMFLYGVLASIGFGGASNVAGSVAVANWFSHKRGFALGLMSAGNAAGQLLLVPFSLFLIEHFGWKVTVLIIGAFLTVVIFPLVFWFIRTYPSEKNVDTYGGEFLIKKESKPQVKKLHVSIFTLLKTKHFLFLMIPFFVCGVTTSGLIDTHLIPFAQACGFSPALTATAVGVLAGFNILGTVLSGFLSDRWSCKNMLAFLYGMRALSIAVLLFIINDITLFGFLIEQPYLLFIFAISFGVVDFATIAPTIKLITEYFEGLSIGVIIGWIYLSHQMGSALGAYLPGLFFDNTGSYQSSFIYSIILLVIASLLSFVLPRAKPVIVEKNHSLSS